MKIKDGPFFQFDCSNCYTTDFFASNVPADQMTELKRPMCNSCGFPLSLSKTSQITESSLKLLLQGSEKIAPDALRASLGEPERKDAVQLEKNRLLQAPKLQMPTDCLTGLCGHMASKVYARVSLAGGGSYVQPLDEIHQAIDGELYDADPGTKLTIELIEMNECTYLVTPDFQGH